MNPCARCRGPLAGGEADRVGELAAHGWPDLPAHLCRDGADSWHVEGDEAADPHRIVALGHEAGGRHVANSDFHREIVEVTQHCRSLDRLAMLAPGDEMLLFPMPVHAYSVPTITAISGDR